MNMITIEDLQKEKYYRKYLQKKNITPETLKSYNIALVHFCNANNKRFDEIIDEVKEEQYPYIDEKGRIHEYDPNFGKIDDYIYSVVTYLTERNNSNSSIEININRLRAVLNALSIKLPKKIEFPKDDDEWNVLTTDEIKYVLNISYLHHQAAIVFMAHTGIRLKDVTSFKIQDFMKATEKYHHCTEIDEFLEKAPQDMMGFWEFIPHKTKKHNILCKVPNSPESSNLLLNSLRQRKKSIERYNKKYGTNLKLEKTDALFSSRTNKFKGPIQPASLTVECFRKNKDLVRERTRVLKQKLDDGEISKDTFHQLIEETPKFHAHGLRKFFITTLARKRVHLRASALMEGHKPYMEQDRSYVDEDELEELIFSEYENIIPALSFEKDEIDFTISKRNKELELENFELKQQTELLRKENIEIRDNIDRQVEDKIDEVLAKYGF